MLLRSSSASLVQPLFPDSPTRDLESNQNEHCTGKVLFNHWVHHLSAVSCNSSPASLSCSGIPYFSQSNCRRRKVIRRAQSEGNLEGLMSTSFDELDEAYKLGTQSPSPDKDNDNDQSLYSQPSFSIYNMSNGLEEFNPYLGSVDVGKLVNGGELERAVSIGDRIRTLESDDFSFAWNTMGLIKEDNNEDEDDEEEKGQGINALMKGLGIEEKGLEENGDGFGGDSPYSAPTSFGDNGNVGDHYKRLLAEEPSNPLLLRNYAQLLQTQGDLTGAEYLFRATLADPKDGEILMQYARLVWELRHDRVQALTYFERAVSAASEDSNVHAAYASFLWEIDESDDDDNSQDVKIQLEENAPPADLQPLNDFEEIEKPVRPPLHLAAGVGIDATPLGGGIGALNYAALYSADTVNLEDYYKRMVDEYPGNALFLRNYAEFLYESKGDFKGAEEYYARAILADPNDGEIVSQYATVVWQIYRDKERAISHFQRAVQATPGNCNVLAAYARFLWEAGEDEGDDRIQETHDQMVAFGGATRPIASA